MATHKRNDAKVRFALSESSKKNISLSDFEQSLISDLGISEDLAKLAKHYQYQQLRRIGAKKLSQIGFSDADIKLLSDDRPSRDLSDFVGMPTWLVDALTTYWRPFLPRYRVNFWNYSAWRHDYVVAYETTTGLIAIKTTSIDPASLGGVYLAPCWDVERYSWSCWNPGDNVELIRTRTYTVQEVNDNESVPKPCEDTWEVNIEYDMDR